MPDDHRALPAVSVVLTSLTNLVSFGMPSSVRCDDGCIFPTARSTRVEIATMELKKGLTTGLQSHTCPMANPTGPAIDPNVKFFNGVAAR